MAPAKFGNRIFSILASRFQIGRTKIYIDGTNKWQKRSYWANFLMQITKTKDVGFHKDPKAYTNLSYFRKYVCHTSVDGSTDKWNEAQASDHGAIKAGEATEGGTLNQSAPCLVQSPWLCCDLFYLHLLKSGAHKYIHHCTRWRSDLHLRKLPSDTMWNHQTPRQLFSRAHAHPK